MVLCVCTLLLAIYIHRIWYGITDRISHSVKTKRNDHRIARKNVKLKCNMTQAVLMVHLSPACINLFPPVKQV